MKEKLSDLLRIVNRKTGDRLRLDYVYGNVQLMLYDPVKRVDVRELSPRVNAGTMRAILYTIDNVFTYMMDEPVSRMRANPILRPGKYEGESHIVRYLHENDYYDDTIGDVQELGWYGKFSGKVKGRGPFHVIVSEDEQGFVTGRFYKSEKELERAWNKIVAMYEGYENGMKY